MSANMMHSVSDIKGWFKVSDLVAALEKNLEAHKVDYAKALEVYRKDVGEAVQKLYDEWTSKKESSTKFDVKHNLGLNAPINCVDGYTNLINMFKIMAREEIELELSEASHFLNDDWDWAVSAKASNSYYLNR